MTRISIQRVYAAAAPGEGVRILVDRLWPRGLSKDKAAVQHWLREVAPSDALRHWFAHDPARWDEFRQRYFAELDAQPEVVRELRGVLAGHPHVTLLYAARDEAHNNAVALLSYLRRHGTAA